MHFLHVGKDLGRPDDGKSLIPTYFSDFSGAAPYEKKEYFYADRISHSYYRSSYCRMYTGLLKCLAATG
jgi:hypothetical protein